VYVLTYIVLCKSLNMCVTNKNYFRLLFASFCHKSIMLQCNILAFITNTWKLYDNTTKEQRQTLNYSSLAVSTVYRLFTPQTVCPMDDSLIDVSPHGCGAKCLWKFHPTSMGQNVYLWANCPWGEMSSVGRNVHGANRP